MAKLCEGARVFTAATDAVAAAADINDLQDQLKGMLNEQWVDITTLLNAGNPGAASYWYLNNSVAYPAWATSAAAAGQIMRAVLPVRTGQKITDLETIIRSNNQNGGTIEFGKAEYLAVGNSATLFLTAAAKVADIGPTASNPWNQSSTNYYRTQTSVSEVVLDGWVYFVTVTASTGGSTNDLYRVSYKAQFGN